MHSNKVKHALVLGELKGVDNIVDLNKGVSFGENFPPGAEYTLHPDFKDHLVPTDSLMNSDGLIVASRRLTDYLRDLSLASVEYHRVTVLDHKGKKLPSEYFIVHPIDPIDCLDNDASGARVSRIGKGVVAEVQKLCLRRDSIPRDRSLVRIATFRKPTLIKKQLAKQLDSTGFTGFRWLELSSYPEL
jgi:hypothetical protein